MKCVVYKVYAGMDTTVARTVVFSGEAPTIEFDGNGHVRFYPEYNPACPSVPYKIYYPERGVHVEITR